MILNTLCVFWFCCLLLPTSLSSSRRTILPSGHFLLSNLLLSILRVITVIYLNRMSLGDPRGCVEALIWIVFWEPCLSQSCGANSVSRDKCFFLFRYWSSISLDDLECVFKFVRDSEEQWFLIWPVSLLARVFCYHLHVGVLFRKACIRLIIANINCNCSPPPPSVSATSTIPIMHSCYTQSSFALRISCAMKAYQYTPLTLDYSEIRL